MEEHLQVAVHIASIPLIHQTIELLAIFLLPPQRKRNEHIGTRLDLEPYNLSECLALECSST